MSHVNFHSIKSRCDATFGTPDEGIDHSVHVSLIHGPAHQVTPQQSRGIETRHRTLQAAGNENPGNKGAAVGDLGRNLAACRVHRVGYRSQFRHHIIVEP